MTKFTPVSKMSKKAQKQYYNNLRKSWNGVDHRTKIVPNKKNHKKSQVKFEDDLNISPEISYYSFCLVAFEGEFDQIHLL